MPTLPVRRARAEANASVIAVDMLIGLLDEGWRECDVAAREFLGPRRSSVFLVPPRSVIEAPSYPEANARCREITGKGLSKQAYALAGKILEVDSVASEDARIFEVHPEVSFQTLAGDTTLAFEEDLGRSQRLCYSRSRDLSERIAERAFATFSLKQLGLGDGVRAHHAGLRVLRNWSDLLLDPAP